MKDENTAKDRGRPARYKDAVLYFCGKTKAELISDHPKVSLS